MFAITGFALLLNPRKYFFFEEIVDIFGAYGEEIVAHGNANALFASPHTERAAQLDFFVKFVFGYETLKVFDNLSRAFYGQELPIQTVTFIISVLLFRIFVYRYIDSSRLIDDNRE